MHQLDTEKNFVETVSNIDNICFIEKSACRKRLKLNIDEPQPIFIFRCYFRVSMKYAFVYAL